MKESDYLGDQCAERMIILKFILELLGLIKVSTDAKQDPVVSFYNEVTNFKIIISKFIDHVRRMNWNKLHTR
jgi:hypothetical protein